MLKNKILIDRDFLESAYQIISQAKEKIFIATFKAEILAKPRGRNLTKLFELIFKKSRLGVDVRFILNNFNPSHCIPYSNTHAICELKKHNVKVHAFRNNRTCHAKILLTDNFAGILGSHNLSVMSCIANFETSYLFYDPYCINELQEVYDKIWNDTQAI